MSRATRKGGRENGLMLGPHISPATQCPDTMPNFKPLDCAKPAFQHLRSRGVTYISLSSNVKPFANKT